MKKILKPSLIVNVLIACVVILLLLSWASLFMSHKTYSTTYITDSVSMYSNRTKIHDDLKPIDYIVPDSISYLQHKRLSDSIYSLRTLRNGDGFLAGGSAVSIGVIGTFCSNYCANCSVKFTPGSSPSFFTYGMPVQNYIMLYGWKIMQPSVFPSDSIRFYVDGKGQSYLRKIIKGSALYKSAGDISNQYAIDVAVPFRYNKEKDCLMIPVKASTKNTVQYVLFALLIVFLLYFLFFIVGGFIKFIIDVSRGQTFTYINVLRLKIIAFSLIIWPVFMFLLNFIIKFIFSSYFTKDVTLNLTTWANSWISLFAGLIFLLLYKAFRDGKKIKEEQDLVI